MGRARPGAGDRPRRILRHGADVRLEATYFSRSRGKLWRKGEESGHTQRVREIRIDCDNDVVLLKVEQAGGIACHTGRARCFFQKLEGERWVTTEAVLKDPEQIYR
jgi:phosphoribosyl-AMP cyclohydrolase